MRTTGHTLDRGLGEGRAPAASRLQGWVLGVKTLIVTLVATLANRRQINTLNDLSDEQLRDIGLSRSDVDAATTAPLFADASADLTRAARRRSNEIYRQPS